MWGRCRGFVIGLLLLGSVSTGALADLTGFTIGVYIDDGAHPSCSGSAKAMFRWMGLSVLNIDAETFNVGVLEGIDMVYFPGGSSLPYIEKMSSEGKAALVEAVQEGMLYIGTCAGAMFAAEVQEWEGHRYSEGQLGVFLGDAVGPVPGICRPDEETCRTALRVNPDHDIAAGLVSPFLATYYNSPFLRATESSGTHVLADYVTTGEPAVVAQRRDKGWVLLTGPHPEWNRGAAWDFMRESIRWCLERSG